LPGGETISDVQRRGLSVIHHAAQQVPGGRFLFVSHGDVIRAILSYYMKLPLNEYRRLRVDNGSLSALQTDRRWAEIKYVNYLAEIILASKEPYMAARAAELRK
jgi:broad specificity phosphatase PhoE